MATTSPDANVTTVQVIPAPERTWQETLRNSWIITRRELYDSLRDWRIIGPLIVLTFGFPFLAQFMLNAALNFVSQFSAEIVAERGVPFLLMIVGFFPISISLVIALESFVGEKERRSLEPLLSTPLTDMELYIGKTLAAMLPPLVATLGGMSVYVLFIFNTDLSWRPQPILLFQIVLLTIVQALVMITGSVVVSSQTTSTRAANLLASFIIIPMAIAVNVESFIMFQAPDIDSPSGIGAFWAVSVAMFLIAILLFRVGRAVFNREALLKRTVDTINFGDGFGNIWKHIQAIDAQGTPAKNVSEWYRRGVVDSLRRLRNPLIVCVVMMVVLFCVGMFIGTRTTYQLTALLDFDAADAPAIIQEGGFGADSSEIFLAFLANNLRVILITTVFSIVTFGVFAVVFNLLTFAILGYLITQMAPLGLSNLLLAGIVPHGIVEIPIILIATAAALQLGAIITRPPVDESVGVAWARAAGDLIKLFFAVVLPGLLVAAFLEGFVTVPLFQSAVQSLG